MDNPHFCTRHNVAHKWLLTSSYCPQCEAAKSAPEVTDREDLSSRAVQQYLKFPSGNTSTIRQQWEAKYGTFKGIVQVAVNYWFPIGLEHNALLWAAPGADFKDNGYPDYCNNLEWHDSIAKVWPV